MQNSWSVDPDVFGDVMEEDLAEFRTTIALDAHKNIVLRTAVDTGHARRNWVITYTTPYSGSEIQGAGDGTSAITKGYQDILRGAKDPFKKVVISNNLPYIRKLENGSSKQAPNGMVAVTMAGIGAKYK